MTSLRLALKLMLYRLETWVTSQVNTQLPVWCWGEKAGCCFGLWLWLLSWAIRQLLRMCSRVSLSPQRWRLGGLGKTSYAAWTMYLTRSGSTCQISDLDTFLSSAPSHLVHAPCCCIPIILLVHSSSITEHTSFRISWCLFLPCAFSSEVEERLPTHTRSHVSQQRLCYLQAFLGSPFSACWHLYPFLEKNCFWEHSG